MADPYLATLDLARRLIACPSVTPAHAGCLDIVADRLAAAGFTCERIDRAGVANLWARRGEEAPIVCLAGHVDVVPPGPVEQWTSGPFTPTERDGFLYGRGAADMKMSVAAMVTAAERVFATDAPRHGSLALLLTSDEEGDAVNGTAAVVDELKARGVTVDACIIGEPTSVDRFGDTVKNGRRGSLNGALRVKGVQCHIAYPERGRNPIHFALPALAELASLVWDRGNEYFPPTSFQISNIQAGTGATNIIPGSLDVLFNVRFSPESTVDAVKARVHAVLDERGLDYELRWSPPGLPFMTARGALVTAMGEAIQSVTGIEPSLSTSGGTSDGRFLATIARQVVEFGPSNASIHGIDERVSLRDIAPLSMIYERVVRALLAGG